MDPAASSSSSSSYGEQGPSPRRELQGPRPSPLKVSKDSYKIAKKPPLFPHHPYLPPPPHQHQHHQQQQHQQPLLQIQNQIQHQHHRSPVIIYAVSPKVIHTTPSDFMSLVQRLTGNSLVHTSSSSSSSSAAAAAAPSTTAAAAAAAAAAEAATTLLLSPSAAAAASPRPQHHRQQQQQQQDEGRADVELLTGRAAMSSSFFPGILSPGPGSLQPISPSLFLASPSLGFDPSVLGYLGDLSPVLSGMVLASPGNSHLLSTPTIPSPGAFWDLLNHFPDPF